MSLDPYLAAVAAAPRGSAAKLSDALRPLVAEFIRAGGRPGDLDAWAAWISLDPTTRTIWSEEAHRVRLEAIAALAKAVGSPAGLLEVLKITEPEAVAGAAADAALDAAEERDRAEGARRG